MAESQFEQILSWLNSLIRQQSAIRDNLDLKRETTIDHRISLSIEVEIMAIDSVIQQMEEQIDLIKNWVEPGA